MSVTPPPFLGVTKQQLSGNDVIDVPLAKIELQEQVSAGIRLRSLGPDMVPLFEEHSARLERGYTIEAWYNLERMERAIIIAQRRLDNLVKAHHNEAEMKKIKRPKGIRKR